ncbi:hypotheticall protein [Colletotrichum fructicola]|nr:uncharacterized protein CGMCC3_g4046 [Colletotrichum fructicola]KAE9580244.1 hypothetical protein CGMCC3_g4046 [Colletotrichum fructicola]KAF4431912.1 Uncharacterized protein CFRS1_v012563 [Colletotrichum fructicola]KAF4892164.1 hypotheticall protein [Colletotrichum fructicola]KAF4902414.1 hypotheticall protein [Colletotrichum fructicola]KAF4933776.1 hypotheticall protein [Colletotrichum fructicola]
MILKGILWSWALLAPCVVAEQQKPLGAGIPKHEHLQQDSWRRGLNFSSPAPHLFASAYGLLQQWSNTVFPNGHTMAAVEIPAFTLLYHGRMDEEDAPSPEWLAFDIEMAYGIMGSTRQSFMLSYQTTRPVKALYFDGESAALMGLGQLDTQMLHLYGNVTGPDSGGGMWRGLEPEYERAMGLCDWLAERGLGGVGGFEGVVRMNAGFEVIWCDFGSGSLRLVSRGNVTAPQMREVKAEGVDENGDDGNGVGEKKGGGEVKGSVPTSVYPLPPQPTRTDRPVSPTKPAVPPNWRGIMGPSDREPFLQSQGWGWFSSGTWHYGGSGMGPGRGETRAKVTACGITSWYSGRFWGSLVEEEGKRLNLTQEGFWSGLDGGNRSVAMNELGRRRRLHHLEGVSEQAAARVRGETEAMLRDVLEGGRCSGMVWVDVFAEIVQRNAGHLMALEKAARWAGDEGNVTEVREWLYKLRGQSHMFLVSFLEYPNEIDRATWDVQGPLFGETYSRCRYRYIRLLVDIPMKPWETDLRDAAEEVMGGICGVLLEVGFEVERAWYALEEGAGARLVKLAERWEDSVRGLRAWVGWEGEFIRCDKVCEWDERCYIPMWPLLKSVWGGRRPRPPPRDGPGNGTEPRPGPPPGKGRGPGYGGGHRGPGYGMPGRGPSWMGDETDLWAPKCVKMDDIMPRPRAD